MDLNELLQKTKKKKEQMGEVTPPPAPSIADDDRPYKSSANVLDLKVTTNPQQNGYQTDSKEVASGYQTDSKEVAKRYPEKLKQVAQRIAEQIANGYQTDSKEVAKDEVFALVGKERSLLLMVFRDCRKNADLISSPFTIERLAEGLETSTNRAKNIIHRLVEKRFIKRHQSKTGRGGWTRFLIEKDLFQKLILDETDSKQIANGYQMDSKEVAKRVAQRIAEPSSSSSVLNIKNITTTEPLNEEWGRIHLGSAEGFGVSRYHINRARELYSTLDPVAVQNLIYRFEKHLSIPDNRKRIRNPGAFFLLLAEKVSKGEMGLPEYKTPDEEFLKKLHADADTRAERAKALIRDIQDKVFETWWIESTSQEKDRLVPNSMVKGIAYKNAVRARWMEEAWPDTQEAKSIEQMQPAAL